MQHYIGAKEVSIVVEVPDKKTPGGSEMVEVSFSDGTKEVMPKQRLELLSSDKEIDLSEIQKKLNTRVGALIFSLLHEYGVKVGETGQIADAVIELVNLSHSRAKEILIGYEASLTPLIAINDILVKERNGTTQESDNGLTPSRSESDLNDTK